MSGGKRKTIANYLVFSILALDQLTKYIVSHKIPLGESLPIIKNIFHLTYILNRGAAFGIFKNQTHFFVIVSIVFIAFMLNKLRHKILLKRKVVFSLILSGAVGNLIDRIRLGAVIDFLDFRIWPVFNIADSAITIGAILLAYSILFQKKEKSINK